jgi:hypothetical protein
MMPKESDEQCLLTRSISKSLHSDIVIQPHQKAPYDFEESGPLAGRLSNTTLSEEESIGGRAPSLMPLREAVFGTTPRGTSLPLLAYVCICVLLGPQGIMGLLFGMLLYVILERRGIIKK